VARHHAVRVQHDHVAVLRAPAATEVGDVAALPLEPDLPATVEDAIEAVDGATPLEPRLLLADGAAGVLAVAQHEEVEVLARARPLERSMDGAQPGEDAVDRLVRDRHDDRRACVRGQLVNERASRTWRLARDGAVEARDREPVAPAHERQEAEERGPEADRY